MQVPFTYSEFGGHDEIHSVLLELGLLLGPQGFSTHAVIEEFNSMLLFSHLHIAPSLLEPGGHDEIHSVLLELGLVLGPQGFSTHAVLEEFNSMLIFSHLHIAPSRLEPGGHASSSHSSSLVL